MCNEELIKTGKVEVGITPSEISGKKSTLIKNGSAVAPGEVKKIRKESDLDIPLESD
jgi:hypothetical protein